MSARSTCLLLGSVAALASWGLACGAIAQVTLDGTANPDFKGPLDGPNYQIPAELGRRAGRNLFHSFERFDLRTLADGTIESATFSGPGAIRNVISRVTGGDPSDINGVIRSTIDGADFFFLNPAGVMFGPNASLDVKGAFHVSTADELRFADGERFSARLGGGSSFTVAPPEAFGFLGADPAPIRVVGSALGVDAGKSFSLVGGDIQINGPGASVVGERVNATALSAPGGVRAADGSPTRGAGGKITLRNRAVVNASAVAIFGGQVLIQGLPTGDLTTGVGGSGAVEILADNLVLDHGFVVSTGAPITITADQLRVRNESSISSSVGSTDGGNITLSTGSARIVGGSVIRTAVAGMGQSGDMTVTATEEVIVKGLGSRLTAGVVVPPNTDTEPPIAGISGQLTITAPRIVVADAGMIDASSGAGPAGDVNLEVGQLRVSGGGAIGAQTLRAADRAGDITIVAEAAVIVTGSGAVTGSPSVVGAFGAGSPGRITITAPRVEASNGALIGAFSPEEDRPDRASSSGEITITVDTLSVTGGANISADSFGSDPGGDVTVKAAKSVQITGPGGISAATIGEGQGGRVQIMASEGSIEITGGGHISTDTFGEGSAGFIALRADQVRIVGQFSRISSDADLLTGSPGDVAIAGNEQVIVSDGGTISTSSFSEIDSGPVRGLVAIRAGELEITDGGFIKTDSLGPADAGAVVLLIDQLRIVGAPDRFTGISSSAAREGRAGDIAIFVADRLEADQGTIGTESANAGGGEIRLLVGDVIVLRDSAVTTSVARGEDSTAGSILIDPEVLVIDGSRIQANAGQGSGGRVRIVADNIRVPEGDFQALLDRGDISASGGDPTRAGTILVNAPEVDLSGGLVVLEGALIDAASQLRERCGARRDVGASSFTGVGRGGLPRSPDGPLLSDYALKRGWLRPRPASVTSPERRPVSSRSSCRAAGRPELPSGRLLTGGETPILSLALRRSRE